jgi:hypothetical protein
LRRRGFIELYLDVAIAYAVIVLLAVLCLAVLTSNMGA